MKLRRQAPKREVQQGRRTGRAIEREPQPRRIVSPGKMAFWLTLAGVGLGGWHFISPSSSAETQDLSVAEKSPRPRLTHTAPESDHPEIGPNMTDQEQAEAMHALQSFLDASKAAEEWETAPVDIGLLQLTREELLDVSATTHSGILLDILDIEGEYEELAQTVEMDVYTQGDNALLEFTIDGQEWTYELEKNAELDEFQLLETRDINGMTLHVPKTVSAEQLDQVVQESVQEALLSRLVIGVESEEGDFEYVSRSEYEDENGPLEFDNVDTDDSGTVDSGIEDDKWEDSGVGDTGGWE
jgi:hypothetical protein